MSSKIKSVWETLSVIDCSGHTEEKNGFTYLSWAWAWQTLKELYPTAKFEKQGHQVLDDGSAMVTVRVYIPGLSGSAEHLEDVSEMLPVIDYKNKAINNPNCFDLNSAYQRCLVKCLAYMGLGMYIYQGEVGNPNAAPSYEIKSPDGKSEKTEDLNSLADIFLTFMGGRNLESLRKFWTMNKAPLEQLENLNPENYKRVFDAFTAKAKELKGDEDGVSNT
jgi:hypothetical protein